MKKIRLFLSIICLSNFCFSQHIDRDSVKQLLASATNDSTRLKRLADLGWLYLFSNTDSALKYIQQEILLATKTKQNRQLSIALRQYEALLALKGSYPQAISFGLQSLKAAESSKNFINIASAYDFLSATYTAAGDSEHAISNICKAKSLFDSYYSLPDSKSKLKGVVFNYDTLGSYLDIYLGLAQTYERFNRVDSALKYVQIVNNVYIQKFEVMKWPAVPLVLGNIYFKKGIFDSALAYYRTGLNMAQQMDVNTDLMDIYVGLSKTFRKLNQIDSSLFYATKALEINKIIQYPIAQLDALTVLADIYKSKKNIDSLAKYLELIITAKESLFNEQKILDVQNLTFNERLRSLEEQEATAKAKQQLITFIIIGLGVALILILIIRNRIRQLKIKHQMIELEAKALRAQMNPHFIFNCMNSIKALVQQNNFDKSVVYLTTFSKLLRTVLQNSDKQEITLYDEIETCRLYTQLESMRFGNKFFYSFDVDETIDLKSVAVPALILQPFIENAIWHGIMPKEGGSRLAVRISKADHTISCTIDDDGIGRKASIQNKSRSANSVHQSKGVRLTQTRLELSNVLNQRNATVEIIDKTNDSGEAAGTKVVVVFNEE